MKRFLITLILMLSIFSITNAHSFKSDKELNEFFSKIDQLIKEELKKDYREEMTKRKGTANNEYSFEIEDDRTGLITRSIAGIKPETKITQYFNKKGELYMISSLTKVIDKELYGLYRKYDKNGNLLIYTYAIDGKNTDKGYYSDGKLAYIQEVKIIEGKEPILYGKYIEYYKNGQIKVQGNYKEDKRDGEFKAFLRNGKSAGSVFYKDGKIIKSTLVKAMKDNASFSPVTDIYYKLEDSHTLRKVDYENGLLKTYFIYNKDGIPDGESVEYYEEGSIESIVHFRNNIVEGLTITYYENGNIDEEVNYKNNKMNGEAKSYDENGKLNGRTIFKDNIKLEEDVYKENEILKNTFKNGELVKQDICTLNGTLKERRILNGDEMEYSTFYPNGNVKQKILTKDKIIIKEQIYAKSGNIMSNSFFSDGKPVTEYFEYYPDGKLFRKIVGVNGKLNGDSIEYYPSGNIKEKIFLVDDKMNGEDIKYYENGVIKEKAYFINDKQEKEHFFYDEKGKLIKTDIYKNGVKQ